MRGRSEKILVPGGINRLAKTPRPLVPACLISYIKTLYKDVSVACTTQGNSDLGRSARVPSQPKTRRKTISIPTTRGFILLNLEQSLMLTGKV